jgi:hypothetical protein
LSGFRGTRFPVVMSAAVLAVCVGVAMRSDLGWLDTSLVTLAVAPIGLLVYWGLWAAGDKSRSRKVLWAIGIWIALLLAGVIAYATIVESCPSPSWICRHV